MESPKKSAQVWAREAEGLRARLEEAEETLRAIREGEVDSLLISTSEGERIYTLEGADHTYRILVETMQQGAVTVLVDGSIFYSNPHLARMLKTPLQQLIGASIRTFVHPDDAPLFATLVEQARKGSSEGEVHLLASDGAVIPVYLALNGLRLGERESLCVAVTDLTPIATAQRLAQTNEKLKEEVSERKRAEKAARQANKLLEAQKEDLQGLAEELQYQAEELKSQAEELQAQSEELQAQSGELREANLELEKARVRLEAIVQQMPAGVLIAEAPSGRLILGNAAVERIFRRPFVSTVGFAGFDKDQAMHPESWVMQDHEHMLARALKGESVTGHEMRILRGDASHGIVSANCAPIRDPEGCIIGAIVALEDITERKRAEEALRLSEERLRFAMAGADAGAWEWDVRTGAIVWSPESYELFGVDPARSATSYADWEHAIHPDDLDGANEAIRETLERRRPEYRAEFRVLHPRRGVRWILALGRVERAPDGAPLRMSGINIDITDRKRAELALVLSARQKSLLADASARVMAQTTQQGVLSVVVEAARAVTQARLAVSGHGYVGGKFLVGAASRAEAVAPCPPGEVFKLQAGGVYVDFVTRGESIRLSDAELRNHPAWWGLPADHAPLRGLLGARLVDDRGKPTGLIMVSDKEGGGELFTEDDEALLRQFAATTSLALQHIEARAEAQQRSAALTEDDRHKNEFLVMLAHELRNPLAPIRNAVQILHLVGSNEQALQRQRGIIDRQVTHMARLLDDLLDISRITRGKIEMQRQPMHLTDVLAHAVETIMPLVESRRHTLAVTMPPDDLRVEGDIDRLAQIVGNLLVNAAKYTNEGGRIWLDAAREGEEAVIRVRDTGVGISAAMLPRIFDLFAQADHSLARTQGGLGIGLTMVKNLTRMHGGRVEARSAGPGQGAEFIIRLPAMAPLPALESEASAPGGSGEQRMAPEAPPRRILVVDDLVDTSASMAELLGLWGHEVRMAHDGPAALEVAHVWRPEVVLLDIGLPGMDGHEVARLLRAEHGEEMLLVALTGYAQESDRQQSHEAGFDHHLPKPIDLVALRELLARQLPG